MAEDMAQTVIALYGDGVEQRYPTTNGILQRTVSCNERPPATKSALIRVHPRFLPCAGGFVIIMRRETSQDGSWSSARLVFDIGRDASHVFLVPELHGLVLLSP